MAVHYNASNTTDLGHILATGRTALMSVLRCFSFVSAYRLATIFNTGLLNDSSATIMEHMLACVLICFPSGFRAIMSASVCVRVVVIVLHLLGVVATRSYRWPFSYLLAVDAMRWAWPVSRGAVARAPW